MTTMGIKRKASEMNGSNAEDYDEPEFKAKKTNENRRRSSFIRGNFHAHTHTRHEL